MPDDLYHHDIVGWSAAQADRLRRLARGERVNDLDWENVIEEVESVGRSELKSVRSLLIEALEHTLKIYGWPDQQAVEHWRAEADTFWRQARRRMDPGMAQHLNLPDAYEDARRTVLKLRRMPPIQRPLPEWIALEPDDVRNPDFDVDGLLARIAGA